MDCCNFDLVLLIISRDFKGTSFCAHKSTYTVLTKLDCWYNQGLHRLDEPSCFYIVRAKTENILSISISRKFLETYLKICLCEALYHISTSHHFTVVCCITNFHFYRGH